MEQEKKVQTAKSKRNKKRKTVLHYVLVYLVCLLAACVTWLSVRYSMRADQARETHKESSLSASVCCLSSSENEFLLYV
jgi:flagellar basal body-associated protein FliL